jgi:integrase
MTDARTHAPPPGGAPPQDPVNARGPQTPHDRTLERRSAPEAAGSIGDAFAPAGRTSGPAGPANTSPRPGARPAPDPGRDETPGPALTPTGSSSVRPDAPPPNSAAEPAAQALIVRPAIMLAPPLGEDPGQVRRWFDAAAAAEIPEHDGTLGTARRAAEAYARRAKSDNTRRAYRAGVRAWCTWCEQHALPCLPARSADVVAFLAAERGRGLSVNTLDLRRAAIRYLHFIAGCAVPTAEAQVAETMAGIHRDAAAHGHRPGQKLAVTIDLLRQILAPIGDDLAGFASLADPAGRAGLADLRDRALLLVGFAGALRRAELAAIRVEHLETRERGLRLTLPHSKGERTGKSVTVAIPYGTTDLCPVRALQRWQAAAGITEGPLFRRIWLPPTRRKLGDGPLPAPVVGSTAIDAGTVARIIKRRAAAAGFERDGIGGHSLKRGALTTGMDRGVHPTRLKQLGRHKSYAVLDTYLELGDPFESHPLNGLL